MTIRLFVYDDPADEVHFLPFTASRPIGELRYGAFLLRERLADAFGLPVEGYHCATHLAGYAEAGAPPVVGASGTATSLLVLRSTFVPDLPQQFASGGTTGGTTPIRLTDATGATIGAVLPRGTPWPGPAGLSATWPAVVLPGKLLAGVWQIVADLVPALVGDLEPLRAGARSRVPGGTTVLGDEADLLLDGTAMVEPMVVFDTRGGPIWVQEGAEIRSFSRLAGPLVVGRGTRIVGGQLRDSSIGPKCVVHGEVSNSIFLGYANKSHDGFLGHSIVGRWANLGAGTITSNLKNTYGPIRLTLGAEHIETGMTYLGALVGDHVKTAIGTMLPTGCVIGTGANLFGTRRPEAVVPAFAWGTDDAARRLACRMFLQTAARVLPRRDVAFDEPTSRYLEAVWRHCTGQPCG